MTAQNMLAVPGRRAGDFWIFWTGQTISQIGSALTSTALLLLVFKLSGSALDLGLASAATWVPYPLFGLFIGAWVDRVNRKRLMIGLDICRAVVLAVLPLLALLGHLPIWWIYLVTFINSTLTIGFQSATTAATLESSGCTQRFESNIYATECMGSSAHKSIHPLEIQLALSYQILPANDEVCAEHGRHACLPSKLRKTSVLIN